MERRDSALDVVHVNAKDQPRHMREVARGLATSSPTTTTTCLLNRLPDELLLIIWEYAVVNSDPLLVNCPCDSSFGGWNEEYHHERDAWKEGRHHPPCQPPLTRVCRSIRFDALSIFYSRNAFRAGYCYECDTDIVVSWLRVIGKQNRELLKDFFFWDANPVHDQCSPKCLKKLKRSAVVRELGGCVDTTDMSGACRHDVRFGQEQMDELEGVAQLFEGVL
ncbi:hypothetical protein BST61_g1792 [Cercospora zeina]